MKINTHTSEHESAECIVPLIKLCLPGSEEQDLLLDAKDSPVLEPLVADLLVSYVFDLPSSYSFVQGRHLPGLQLSSSDLRNLAVNNLRRRLPDILRHPYPQVPVFVLAAGGNLESSLLLLDDLWESQSPLVPGELVVSVPARDCIAFTGSASREGIAELKASIERVAGGDHVLTRHLLIRRDSSWQLFEPDV